MNNVKRFDFLTIVICLGVLLLNFSPFKPANYPLTLAPFVSLYLMFKFIDIKQINAVQLILLFNIPIYVLIVSLDSDIGIEFFRTFILWLFYFVFFVFSFNRLKINRVNESICSIKLASVFLIWLLFFLVLCQVFYFKFTGDISVFAIWGDYSYGGQSYTLSAIEFGASKANGPYLEPSFLGLVVFFMLSLNFVTSNKSILIVPLLILSVLSGSAAVMVSVFLMLSVIFLKRNDLPDDLKKYGHITRLLVIFLLVIFVFAIGPYIIIRFDDFVVEGSSSYYRFVAPLDVLSDVLAKDPFGVAFGNMESVLLSYGMLNGVNEGSTLDNGWYLMVFYFGWPGMLISISCLFASIYFCLFKDAKLSALALYLVLSPLFTGAVFSPEFLMLQMLIWFSYRLQVKKNA